jgi:hypothetical protein
MNIQIDLLKKYKFYLYKVYADYMKTENSNYKFEFEKGVGLTYLDRMNNNINNGNWGKEKNSISEIEYAYIANMAYMPYEEIVKYIESKFPEGHPLRNANIIRTQIDGLDICILELDKDTAIISFGGTQGTKDLINDVNIGLNMIFNPFSRSIDLQTISAEKFVKDLGYKNISATGHSLGAHIASIVATNDDRIMEVVGFDPAGGTIGDAINSLNDNRIKHIASDEDRLHKITFPIGDINEVDVGDGKTDFLMGEHAIENHINFMERVSSED